MNTSSVKPMRDRTFARTARKLSFCSAMVTYRVDCKTGTAGAGEERTRLKMKSILRKVEVREGERPSPVCEHLDSAIPEIRSPPTTKIIRSNKFSLCLT